ncbi:hypothetical protein NDU88_002871 [Pleurodeles waltl]|uniref:Uncharacterized protein n=1 Tax=Pleurodeles waltl TaxID=8319 RepID=A0AAV7T447_PLEWA|nr:hypothetical protein NDU88_002871 [Pleurodeles waltl]
MANTFHYDENEGAGLVSCTLTPVLNLAFVKLVYGADVEKGTPRREMPRGALRSDTKGPQMKGSIQRAEKGARSGGLEGSLEMAPPKSLNLPGGPEEEFAEADITMAQETSHSARQVICCA